MRDARDIDLLLDRLLRDAFVTCEGVGTGKTVTSIFALLDGGAAQPDRAENLLITRSVPVRRLGPSPPRLSCTAALRRVHDALLHQPSIPYGLRAQRWATPAGVASVSCR